MKKYFLLLAIGLIISQGIYGQFSVGISTGINASNVKFQRLDQIDPAYNFNYFFGVVPKYYLNSKLAFLTSIQYSPKGYLIDNSSTSMDLKIRHTYLDILPELEYKIHQNIGLGLGVNVGYKFEEATKTGNNDWFSTKEFELIKSFDFGLLCSVRGHFKNFFLSLSYNHGLTDITNIILTDPNGEPIPDAQKEFNRNIQIGIGYFFGVGKN